ncbi:unnamed protein product, partial [Adineta ricciae]
MSSSAINQATAGNVKNKVLSVLITGPYGAGKKTIVRMTKYGEIADLLPTIGVDFEKITIDETPLLIWSIGGRSGHRATVTQYYRRMSAFIFVVDSNDHLSIGEARERLHQIVGDDRIEDKPILIFANK